MKKKRRFIQSLTGIIVAYLLIVETNLFAVTASQFFPRLGFIFVLSILFMIISHFLITFFITVCKWLFCKYKGYKLQTISIFPFIFNIEPKKIRIGKIKYFVLNDLTNLQFSDFCKSDELGCDLLNIEFEFNKISRELALICIIITSVIFFVCGMHAFACSLIGSSIGAILADKEDDYYNNIDNTFSNQINMLNIYRFALKRVCIEDFDKSKLYCNILKEKPYDNWTLFYSYDLIIESITDSIIDNKVYISPAEYVEYLRKNTSLINNQRPDTIKILRYFYIYNLLKDNTEAMNEIYQDILYQYDFIEYAPIFKGMKYHLVNRWIEEINTHKFSFINDDKYALANYSYIYLEKRKELEKLVNDYLNIIVLDS